MDYLSGTYPTKTKPLPWQTKGLSYTASGYGAKIPTQHIIKVDNRWRRIYATCYSNAATMWITFNNKKFIVESYNLNFIENKPS